MTAPAYHSLEELVAMINEPQGSICAGILDDHRELFQIASGSSHNHQAWAGGYWDHVTEVMNIAVLLYPTLNEARKLRACSGFTLSDALLVLFVHDIEKPWKYTLGVDGKLVDNPALSDKAARKAFRDFKLQEYGLELDVWHSNALLYVEGELDAYSDQQRAMWPLASFCHVCDVLSARLWPEFPRKEDSWAGAKRIAQDGPLDWDLCLSYGSDKTLQERNFSAVMRYADLHCVVCGQFVRSWDPN